MARKLVWMATVLAVLLGVFGLYLQPDFMVQMADQIWSCF
jgi:hypothetical protein